MIEDTEIQSFAHEMAHEAFGWEDGNFRGMPEKIETKETLVCFIYDFRDFVGKTQMNAY